MEENHINPDGSTTKIRTSEHQKLRIGHVPVMVKSRFCSLHGEDTDILEVGECVHDQGGYFVINGSEKVIVAQERMAANFCYVFEKKNSKYCWVAEIRSMVDQSNRPPQQFTVSLLS